MILSIHAEFHENIHKCKSNNGSNIVNDSPDRFKRYEFAYRNEVYVYRREGIAGWVHLGLKTILHLTKVIIKSKDNKKRRIQIIWNATKEGLSFKPTIEHLRTDDGEN